MVIVVHYFSFLLLYLALSHDCCSFGARFSPLLFAIAFRFCISISHFRKLHSAVAWNAFYSLQFSICITKKNARKGASGRYSKVHSRSLQLVPLYISLCLLFSLLWRVLFFIFYIPARFLRIRTIWEEMFSIFILLSEKYKAYFVKLPQN